MGDYGVKEYAYYTSRNLLACLLGILVIPFRMIYDIVYGLRWAIKGCDGTTLIAFPWEQNWNPFIDDYDDEEAPTNEQ